LKVFERFHSAVLLQLCYYGYYQDLEEGITRESVNCNQEDILLIDNIMV